MEIIAKWGRIGGARSGGEQIEVATKWKAAKKDIGVDVLLRQSTWHSALCPAPSARSASMAANDRSTDR